MRKCCHVLVAACAVLGWSARQAGAQAAPPQQAGGQVAAQASKPAPLPPPGSPPLLRYVQIDFPTQGGVSVIDPQTYLYYIKTPERVSRPSDGVWMPYDEKVVLEDFRRLWDLNYLDNLWIEVKDAPYDNGVTGKWVVFNLEERQRVKIVSFAGTKAIEQTKIDEKLREENATIKLDSFIDAALVQKVKGIVLGMLAEKGFQYATIKPDVIELAGGPKLVNLTFRIDEGPKVKIGQIEFVDNKAVSDRVLRRQMKENKARGVFSFIVGKGSYQAEKFEEDAQKVAEYYHNRGYVTVQIGEPQVKIVEDSTDRRTRWIQLRIPVLEGERYRVGAVAFADNTVVKTEALQRLFSKLKPGKFYNEKAVRKAMEKTRDLYGSIGYYQFAGLPDLKPREEPGTAASRGQAPTDGASATDGAAAGAQAPAAEAPAGSGAPQASTASAAGRAPVPLAARRPGPLVDVTIRLQEGRQYFINRITFVGNSTTRDNVVRREMQLFEGGVLNTEALKYSIKRINQLGYFKALEGEKDVQLEPTPGVENKYDVTLKFEEQNRNQITFGAGISEYEGFFGQLSFQTANFMGRGEMFTVSLQAGSRAQNYQVAFTEPFLFDRPITGGVDIYKRELKYINQFTQRSVGGDIVFGFPLSGFTRMFINYSYEKARVTDVNSAYLDPSLLQYSPWLADSLLLNQKGARTISKITPSVIRNTIDNPIFPTSGSKFTAMIDLAGIGGNTNFFKPQVEGIWYIRHTSRTSVGLRGQFVYVAPFKGSLDMLPVFEKIALGGEYSIRGYDLRTIGPKVDPVTVPPNYFGSYFLPGFMPGEVSLEPTTEQSGLVIGGNKSLLFNAEYLISIAGPVRLVFFYDAGQALAAGKSFAMDEFKTSTGAEVRFFMPVLNVPFRLIFAYNPNRSGVLDYNYNPAKRFIFKFAVGSTF